jgi:hypothetical protein
MLSVRYSLVSGFYISHPISQTKTNTTTDCSIFKKLRASHSANLSFAPQKNVAVNVHGLHSVAAAGTDQNKSTKLI